MPVKGINLWINDGKESILEDDFLKLPAEDSVEQNLRQRSEKRESAVKLYLKHILPCDLFRLVVTILLLCALIVFIKQSKYTIISIEHMKTITGLGTESFEDVEYNLMENSEGLLESERYKYDIIVVEEEYNFVEPSECSNIPDGLKFDCYPEDGASELSCAKRGCCWNKSKKKVEEVKGLPLNVPYCYYPTNWSLYKYENDSKHGGDFVVYYKQVAKSAYKNDIPLIKMESISIDSSIIRVKISDPSHKRYEPPWPIRSDKKPFMQTVSNPRYKVNVNGNNPGFKINRADDGTTLLDTSKVGGFIFADQFLQMSSILPSQNIYGLGEHRSTLKLNTNWKTFTMFNKDEPPSENLNLYGSHPFYMVVEKSGKAHGVLILNSNAMDIILQPGPGITFRTIGGIFDIYVFLGPTPADVVRQYSEIVGKPFLPPYWSLGFHLCRYGYGSLEKTKEIWNKTRSAGIPFDTQWNDLDYMDQNNDFTYDRNKFKDLPQFINDLHSMGMHYIPLIDAGISGSESNGTYVPYVEGVKQGVFVKNAENNEPFVGKVWNYNSTVWPDFTNPKTTNYYLEMMKNLHSNIPFDGAWIDMNEPSNFYNGLKNGCPKNNYDYPAYVPYVANRLLATKTLCMNAKHYLGHHYNLHNTYGISQAVATNYALRKIRQKRPFIISRSTWVGHGHYAGHWSGDVFSTWHDLRMSIPEVLSFNFFQIPMMGADICGFNGNTTAALCNRWMQLGAFYPFSRNHNSDDTIAQDPVAMGDLVVKSSKRALTIRYWLLPYLYTLFFRAHKFGDTVARPLFFEFPEDPLTYDIDTQFLWGKSFMIIPVLEEKKTTVDAYLPRGIWYDLYTKKSIFAIGKRYTLKAPLDTIPLLIRGGSILPAQKPGLTTTESRKNSFELIVALDHNRTAQGELYWDDGDSLDTYEKKQFLWLNFTVKNEILSSTVIEHGSFSGDVILSRIQVLGVAWEVYKVFVNEKPVTFKYDADRQCLSIAGLHLNLKDQFKLHWDYSNSDLHNIQNIT